MKENRAGSGLRDRTRKRFIEVALTEPFWWLKVVGSQYMPAGVPDFIVCYRGRFGAIELKGDGNDLSPAQIVQRKWLERAGAVYVVGRSMEDVETLLRVLTNV